MNDIKIKNPELHRNIWLELSPNRLIIMPIIIAAAFFIVYLVNKDNPEWVNTMRSFALLGFGGLVLFWGSKLATESIVDELNNHTWDAQRLTLLSPWQMAIGKLIGSTIYQWYGGLLCLLVYLVAGISIGESDISFKTAIMFVLAGFFVHSMAIIMSLLGIKKGGDKTKINSTGFFLFSLILAGYISSYIIPISSNTEKTIDWFFFNISLSNFGLASILFFTGWAVTGLYRVMRAEFQYQNGAEIWLYFLFTVVIYLGGLAANIHETVLAEVYVGLYICFAVTALLSYILAIVEPKYIVDFRKQIQLIKMRQFYVFLQKAPLWILSIGVTLFFILPLIIVGLMIQNSGAAINSDTFNANLLSKIISSSVLLPFTLFFFLLRDIAILVYFNLAKNPKRADLSFLLYLSVIYFVVPFIFHLSDSKSIQILFWPSEEATYIQPFIVLIEALAAIFFMIKRFETRNKELK